MEPNYWPNCRLFKRIEQPENDHRAWSNFCIMAASVIVGAVLALIGIIIYAGVEL